MKLDRVVIKVADYRKSFEFYHDILGLKLVTSWQRADSWGAVFYCGEVMLEIIWFSSGDKNIECSYIPQYSKTDIFITVNNIDSEHNRLSKFENIELSEPEDMPWGYRIFTIADPDSVKIVISQPI